MAIHIKGGTPLYGPSLCETCSKAHIEKGYRENEQTVFCTATYFEHRVPFLVRQCSGYREIKRQTLEQMEGIAWEIPATGRRETAGFHPGVRLTNCDEKIELILDHDK